MTTSKVFALGSVTALAGLVLASQGCSSRVFVISNEGGAEGGSSGLIGSGGTSDGGIVRPVKDGGAKDTGVLDPDPPPGGTCPTNDPIDATSLPWKSPRKLHGSCTQPQVDAFIASFDSSKDLATAKASITSTTCRNCIFGPDGATWPPLVETAAGEVAVINVGGCIAVASNNDKCGKAYQQWSDCRFEACADCADGTAFSSCVAAASKTACKAAVDAVTPACGSATVVSDAETACHNTKYIFEAPMRALCVNGP
jgi:hypothetical protein